MIGRAIASGLLALALACGESGQNGRDVLLDFRPAPAGSGGAGGSVGAGGTGGGFAAPSVVEMTPLSGDYGTTVTITGSGLGSAARAGSELLIDNERLYVITPDSPEVQSWSEEAIQFRFPFPYQGSVAVLTPQGAAVAGEFSPSWDAGPGAPVATGSALLSSLAPAPGQVTAAFSGFPIRVLEFDAALVSESNVPAEGINPSSFRLYRAADGSTQAFALSTDTPPLIVSFAREGSTWTATPSSVTASGEFRIAGGLAGGVVWFSTSEGWYRARTVTGSWSVDKGPIVPPSHPDLVDYAADAAGALYVAFNQDTGNVLDDIETPFLQRLGPDDSTFGGAIPAGSPTDDYLTDLKLGAAAGGVVVYYCGSDSDPFGFSGTGFACFFSGYAAQGALLTLPYAFGKPAYAVADAAIAAAVCDGDSLRLITNTSSDTGPIAAWPCSEPEAVDFDSGGSPRLLVRSGTNVFSPRPRLAP